ncbi:MAG: hypothetical protein ACUVQ0_06065 [Thermoproteota archaeon]
MINPSKLHYIGIVVLMIGLGFSILTIMRGLPTHIISSSQFSLPGNFTIPLFTPSMWPPRNVRISVHLSGGDIDLLFFDKPGFESFSESGDMVPVKEFKGLRRGVVNFEIPVRGEYFIVARNSGASTIDGEIVLTFWGFEKDLTTVSVAAFILGAVFLVAGWLMGKQHSSKFSL